MKETTSMTLCRVVCRELLLHGHDAPLSALHVVFSAQQHFEGQLFNELGVIIQRHTARQQRLQGVENARIYFVDPRTPGDVVYEKTVDVPLEASKYIDAPIDVIEAAENTALQKVLDKFLPGCLLQDGRAAWRESTLKHWPNRRSAIRTHITELAQGLELQNLYVVHVLLPPKKEKEKVEAAAGWVVPHATRLRAAEADHPEYLNATIVVTHRGCHVAEPESVWLDEANAMEAYKEACEGILRAFQLPVRSLTTRTNPAPPPEHLLKNDDVELE